MARSTDWCHETTLPPDLRSPARARGFVVQHLVEHRLLTLVDPVRLVASELATNAVVHAQTPFTLTLAERADAVTVSVEDARPGLVPHLDPFGTPGEHGHGLRIVDLLSQDWGVSTDAEGAKQVWASFAIRRGPLAQARP
jgi:anti-sigma regulatory factor (Ser/Thr protein kinase)